MLNSNKKIRIFLTSIISLLMMVLTTLNGSITAKATSINGQAIINDAIKYLGKPYQFGSTGPDSFDCSGFTQYVYRNVTNIEIGRTTSNQINSGREVSYNELTPGDLVFTSPGHVGIYIGNGQMIHAPRTGEVIKISPIFSFWKARRIIEESSNIENLLFNAEIYSNRYSDLKNAFGNDTTKLNIHFFSIGINEGRFASEVFDVSYYLSHNPDLSTLFGSNNYRAAYNHFISNGYKESRDLSPVFNMAYYIRNNPDVAKAYGNDFYGIMNHFLTCGMKEGRSGSENFNLNIYKSKYGDLKNAFGDDNKAYFDHYLLNGINEGRTAK